MTNFVKSILAGLSAMIMVSFWYSEKFLIISYFAIGLLVFLFFYKED